MYVSDRIRTIRSLFWRGQFGANRAYKSGEKTAEQRMAEQPLAGIYQKKYFFEGPGLSHMKLYKPTNPQTVKQQANRSIFADGVAHWQSLTQEEKQAYNEEAKARRMSGFNLHMREWMNTNA